MEIIASSIGDFFSKNELMADYDVVVCSERVFVDDYAPKREAYLKRLQAVVNEDGSYDFDSMPDGYERPDESPYQHTVFIVIKLGQGEMNFAIWNCPMSIQIVSEENCMTAARDAMVAYINVKNFRYDDGIIQSYFTPESTASQQEMYAGFRALFSVRGFVRVPEDGIVFAMATKVENEDGEMFDYPFVSVVVDHNAVPDPQPFAGTHGATMAMNRQTTQTLSLVTYLWNDGGDFGWFSKSVMKAMLNMNKTFHFAVLSNIEDEDGIYDARTNKKYLPISDFDYVLVGAHYSQDWGGIEAWTLTFTRAEANKNG